LKKLIAITLLFIHLYNIGGQLAFHQYLVYKSDRFFNEQVNKNLYSLDDLTEVKIPVNMPNVADWKGYLNLNGEVRFENSSYNYVKIKITHDAIYLMCVPNYKTTHLSGQNIINARQIKDIPVPHKDHVPFGKIILMTYNHPLIQYAFVSPLIVIQKETQTDHSAILHSFSSGPVQPPDSISPIS
jgi:hypothetical protein